MKNIELKIIKTKGFICAEKQQFIRLLYLLGIINEEKCEELARKNVMDYINNDLRKYCELNNIDLSQMLKGFSN